MFNQLFYNIYSDLYRIIRIIIAVKYHLIYFVRRTNQFTLLEVIHIYYLRGKGGSILWHAILYLPGSINVVQNNQNCLLGIYLFYKCRLERILCKYQEFRHMFWWTAIDPSWIERIELWRIQLCRLAWKLDRGATSWSFSYPKLQGISGSLNWWAKI